MSGLYYSVLIIAILGIGIFIKTFIAFYKEYKAHKDFEKRQERYKRMC